MPRHKDKKHREICKVCGNIVKSVVHHLMNNHLYTTEKIAKYVMDREDGGSESIPG